MKIPAFGYKPGIVSRGDRADWALQQEQNHLGWWPFAFTIFEEFENDWQPRDNLLLERLYASLRSGNGVYKITAENRFQSFDAQLIELARQIFDERSIIVVHDVACSSGITSLELLDRFRAAGMLVQLRASDWYDRLFVVRLDEMPWTVVFDAIGAPLQLVRGNIVLSSYRTELWRFPVNRLIQWRWRGRVLAAASAVLSSNTLPLPGECKVVDAGRVTCVSLFHPKCIGRASTDTHFELGREDLFAPLARQNHLIRVMNALSPQHFSEQKVIESVRALLSTLREGGLLVLGRTAEAPSHTLLASIYRYHNGRLEEIYSADGPYEFDAAVRQLTLKV